jgi:hypothetical protein
MPRVNYRDTAGGGSAVIVTVGTFLQLEGEGQKYVTGLTEEVVVEEGFNFDLLSSANLVCRVTALTQQTGGAVGTYRVRVGGTIGAADGVEFVAFSTANAAYTTPPDTAVGSVLAKPTGPQLVKITARANTIGERARVRGYQIAFIPV